MFYILNHNYNLQQRRSHLQDQGFIFKRYFNPFNFLKRKSIFDPTYEYDLSLKIHQNILEIVREKHDGPLAVDDRPCKARSSGNRLTGLAKL